MASIMAAQGIVESRIFVGEGEKLEQFSDWCSFGNHQLPDITFGCTQVSPDPWSLSTIYLHSQFAPSLNLENWLTREKALETKEAVKRLISLFYSMTTSLLGILYSNELNHLFTVCCFPLECKRLKVRVFFLLCVHCILRTQKHPWLIEGAQ